MNTTIKVLIILVIFFCNINCKKDGPTNNTLTNPAPPPPPPAVLPPPPPPPSSSSNNYRPSCRVGSDKLVFYPSDSCNLGGSISGGYVSIAWRKISGPSSYMIESATSLGTKLTKLEIGVYQFELSVSDANGVADRDTCKVIVDRLSADPKEITLDNLWWSNDGLLWGSQLIVPNVYQYLPSGSVFKMYIKRDNSTTWEELKIDDANSYYLTDILHGDLMTWSGVDETDTPNIKLVY